MFLTIQSFVSWLLAKTAQTLPINRSLCMTHEHRSNCVILTIDAFVYCLY